MTKKKREKKDIDKKNWKSCFVEQKKQRNQKKHTNGKTYMLS